jgi:hypothetical protein
MEEETMKDETDRRGVFDACWMWLPLLVLPLGAWAQALDQTTLVEIDDDDRTVNYQGVSIDQLEDMDVVRNDAVIGEVEEVLGDSSGQVVALVVEYGGNALGIGDKEVIVPVGDVRVVQDRNRVEISLSDAELDGLTPWRD